MPNISLIGIDCAAQPENVGLALGQFDGKAVRIQEVMAGKNAWKEIEDKVIEWMDKQPVSLIALDAPLGWPEVFGSTLACHKAGQELKNKANFFLTAKPIDISALN